MIGTHQTPWGYYQITDSGPGFVAMRIEIDPKQELSPYSNKCRQIAWTVVRGHAEVILDDHTLTLKTGDTFHIPKRAEYRLFNRMEKPLIIVAVQTWEYSLSHLTRFENAYGRRQEIKA